MLSTNRVGVWTFTGVNPFAAIERDPQFDLVAAIIPGTATVDSKANPLFLDYSNAQNAITAVNMNTTVVAGKFEPSGLSFLDPSRIGANGSRAALTMASPVNSHPGSGDFTIRCWANQTLGFWNYGAGYDPIGTIASKYDPNLSPGKEWTFQRADTGFIFTAWTNDSTPVQAAVYFTTFTYNVYEHYQVTISNGRIYFFLNGNLINAGGTAFGVNVQSTASRLVIGSRVDGTTFTYAFPGYLDQVEVSKVARNTSSFPVRTSVQPTYKDIQRIYDVPGTYHWLCPIGVTSISAVAIGAGASYSGSGGSTTFSTADPTLVLEAKCGAVSTYATASYAGGNGGTYGGGGAAGYAGNGGNGGAASSNGAAGTGGAAGGGADGGGGGGVGLLGMGASGLGGIYGSSPGGKAGSGGADGSVSGVSGGVYGGGAVSGGPGLEFSGGSLSYKNSYAVTPGTLYTIVVGAPASPVFAGKGGLRIIWPASYNGYSRVFPSTWTQDV